MKLILCCFITMFSHYLFAQNAGIATNNPYRAKPEVHGAAQPPIDKGILLINSNNFHNWGLRVIGSDGHLNPYYDGLHRERFEIFGDHYVISDRRLKTNVQALPLLLDKIMLLQPVEYEMIYKKPLHQKNIGFIAREVKRLFPELVNVISDTANGYNGITDLHTLNYSGFGILAIKAVQEQQAIIGSLQIQIAAVEANLRLEIERQQKLIEDLAKRIEKLEPSLVSKE